MRILLWHGWLLEGSGSNVYTAKTAEAFRQLGHHVLLVCQERHPERFPFIDEHGTVGPGGVAEPRPNDRAGPAPGRVTLLRPEIGPVLPVFVVDAYEGFDRVVAFTELTDLELATYLDRNVQAVMASVKHFSPDVVITGHAVPGALIAARALTGLPVVAKVHGSDIEYAIRPQQRYRDLAAEGLAGARAVVGASLDVVARLTALVPDVAGRTRVLHPGVEVERFRPMPRREALKLASVLLGTDPDTVKGRPAATDRSTRFAFVHRDAQALDDLARRYDQQVPDPDAADRLRKLAAYEGPLIGYFGKLIPQKGVELLIQALVRTVEPAHGLIVGFGSFREWLTALVQAINLGDAGSVAWLGTASPMRSELSGREVRRSKGLADRLAFTGRLDHRYAPAALAGLDILVVPSVLDEAFGMVAAEGAACGALPLVARHSGLAEVADALEGAADRPGLFSFRPGKGASGRIARGVDRLLSLPAPERRELSAAVSGYVAREWTWERTARRLLEAAADG